MSSSIKNGNKTLNLTLASIKITNEILNLTLAPRESTNKILNLTSSSNGMLRNLIRSPMRMKGCFGIGYNICIYSMVDIQMTSAFG